MYRLENWKLISNKEDCPAPEDLKVRLQGNVYNRYDYYSDGDILTSTKIIKIDGKVVTTFSGSIYELGESTPEEEKLLEKYKKSLIV